MRAPAAVVLLLAASLAGCTGASTSDLSVVASAPRLADGITILVAVPRGLFGGASEETAHFTISHEGRIVYPGTLGAPVPLKEGRGQAFVEYARFVTGNGDYTVTVRLGDKAARAQVAVEKWVSYVYALPYVRNENTLVTDVVLARASGNPNERIFAAGELHFEVRYRGQDGRQDQMRLARVMTTDPGQSFQRIELPFGAFMGSSGNRDGYYSVEATFHNFQAYGNNNVPMDPALGQARPPTNWVYIDV